MTRLPLLRLLGLMVILLGWLQPVPSFAQSATLTISGTPPTSAIAGTAFRFTPGVSGGRTSRRFFWVRSKPAWASFDRRTGTLSGAPSTGDIGTYSNIRIGVTDGRSSANLSPFSITVVARTSTTTTPVPAPAPAPAPTTNRAPVISGTPSTTAATGAMYAFQPTASDPDGDTLSFTIQSRPTWASFSPTTGRLSGTPSATDVGTTSGITILASDGKTASALPAFAVKVTAATTTPVNRAPTIAGTPQTSVVVGQPYEFQPSGSDPDGDVIAFGIANKPAWATFSAASGLLSGTPSAADTGTTSNIAIAVSDSQAYATLAAFSITVTQASNGSVTLNWDAPTTNTDGSPLTDLAGYQIRYGTAPMSLTQTVRVANAGVTTYVVSNLVPGIWYFALSAYNTAGVGSEATTPATGVVQ
jgi:Putative Ig domain